MVILFIENLLYKITYLKLSIITKNKKYIKKLKFILRFFNLLNIIYKNKIYRILDAIYLIF